MSPPQSPPQPPLSPFTFSLSCPEPLPRISAPTSSVDSGPLLDRFRLTVKFVDKTDYAAFDAVVDASHRNKEIFYADNEQ